ncbi:alpha/beta hydrolase [Rhodococcus erythropolis]|uniref:alpha/beta hydrolase n=1 Tax=Rhodococcus erythropolis TaxID=1833 RepID=UPI0037A4505F
MSQRDRIDPEARQPLEQLLQALPGGFNSIPDITQRRAVVMQMGAASRSALEPNPNVAVEDRLVPGPEGAPDVPVRIYRPSAVTSELPGIFYIHGGGMALGSIDSEDLSAAKLSEEVGAVVVSTGYRKAPEESHPAQLNDCYAALTWMVKSANELGVDTERIALYGGSAGGNLTIAVAMTARDNGFPEINFMMPLYPMIDDRNETPSSHEITDIGIWDRSANIEAWKWFLGDRPADEFSAPSRAENLAGLPPAFIDVGELDVFRDEDIAFAQKLIQSGVPTEFHIYPGVYHASETFAPTAAVSQRMWVNRLAALRTALHPSSAN